MQTQRLLASSSEPQACENYSEKIFLNSPLFIVKLEHTNTHILYCQTCNQIQRHVHTCYQTCPHGVSCMTKPVCGSLLAFSFYQLWTPETKKIWNWHLMILSTGHLGALLLRFKMLARNLYQTSTSITNYTINQPSYESIYISYQLNFFYPHNNAQCSVALWRLSLVQTHALNFT